MMAESYQVLPFETAIFSQSVWRLCDVEKAESVVQDAIKQNVALISYRENNQETDLDILHKAGFYPVEILVTLEKSICKKQDWPEHVSEALYEDAEEIAALARYCFNHDRYHTDQDVSDDIADEIKSRWMFNAVSGRADKVFVYKSDQKIIGFNACLIKDRKAVIDLIGVDQNLQGQGIGSALIQAMEKHYQKQADYLRLGTQLSNEKSQRFYEKLGFKEVSRQRTWHWTKSKVIS